MQRIARPHSAKYPGDPYANCGPRHFLECVCQFPVSPRDKALSELTLGDCAYLATLPKAPSNYDPFKYPDRAVARRNWVIDRIVENGFAKADEGEKAKASPLGVTKRSPGAKIFAS